MAMDLFAASRPFAFAAGLISIATASGAWAGGQTPQPTRYAYFQFMIPPHTETFVFATQDPGFIAESRFALDHPRQFRKHIAGTIRISRVWYNGQWQYHLDPQTLAYAEASIEVCDASIDYIEANIKGHRSPLPKDYWCPWGFKLVREIKP